MYTNIGRRLILHEQRKRISICIAIILVISIYLTINSVEKCSNEQNVSLINPLKTYLCPQLSSSSKGYFRVDFTENFPLNYSSICKSNDILLIYILSTSTNFERRDVIRRTWAKKEDYEQLNEICFVFIVGLSNKNSNIPFNGDIRREALLYHDIIQLNIKETYQNVVYKEVAALKWSHIYTSKIPFLFKTDDDLILDTLLLSDIIKFLIHNRTDHSLYFQQQKTMQEFTRQFYSLDRYTLFKGRDMGGIHTFRDGKFGIHQLAWNNDQLPPYCSGFGFLYSSFIRDRLYRASLCYANEYVPLVGDVFLSGFLAGAASIRCSGWPLLIAQPIEGCPALFQEQPNLLVCSSPLHRGGRDYSEFYAAWQIILGRHPTTFHRTQSTTSTLTTPFTYSSNTTRLFLKNFIGKDKIIQQNQTNQMSRMLSINSSNKTFHLWNQNQIILNKTNSIDQLNGTINRTI